MDLQETKTSLQAMDGKTVEHSGTEDRNQERHKAQKDLDALLSELLELKKENRILKSKVSA